MRSQRTEAARIVRARRPAQRARGRDVQVRAVVALRTDPVARELFALALVAQVEGVRELALCAFLAEPALVVFADQVADAAALGGRDVVSIWTVGAARAFSLHEGLADWAVDFGGAAECWDGGLEVVVEGEGGRLDGLGVYYLVG